jgi:hypothetical protein
MKTLSSKLRLGVALAAGVYALAPPNLAGAQEANLLSPGDAVVTGFSGIAPLNGSPTALGIDLQGPSAQVLPLSALPGTPNGSMTSVPAKRMITAAEVGQVFAIALDEGDGEGQSPNVYLGATSMFGLHIVEAGGGERLENGEPGAEFMNGQFGPDGTAGSIWKIDGGTGEVSEFTRLPDNSGPGVGDVVFDAGNGQFFASDLDTGLIHRIGADGALLDSFDHGVQGLGAAGGEEVEDDGSRLDITNAAFDTADPATWGYTQEERRVWGLAVRDGRLYYSTGGKQQVWSIGLTPEGGFAEDARLEFDIEGLAGDGPVTDLAFDKSGRIYVAQRGVQKSSFNFAEFAEPASATVLRFKPAESGQGWEPDADSYAIGMPSDHNNANGGVALGYDHDETGMIRSGTCDAILWATGGRLVASDGDQATEPDVHGLQGNAVSLARPENTPPSSSWFVDYDGMVGDATKAGHMGDVEIFQPCGEQTGEAEPRPDYPEGYLPPGEVIPPDWPPDFPPPEFPFNTNLELIKRAAPQQCTRYSVGWFCRFTIRVRNTGPDVYFGHILVKDFLPATPAGALMVAGPQPPWGCWNSGPAQIRCWRPNVLLNPGQSVFLNVGVLLPPNYDRCRVRNIAEIEWAPGGTQWNTDPGDDRDGASARVPLPQCLPAHQPQGSIVHQPIGSVVHRPQGSVVHRPRGSDVHRPRGSIVHRPEGSVVHRPRGSDVHRPRGSIVHRPRGSDVHRPRGSVVHRPRGSDVHRPRGSIVHRQKGSVVHRPRGSDVHRPRGSRVHRPHGSRVHRPRGSDVHRPRGSRVHRPRGSDVHRPRGSRVHNSHGSRQIHNRNGQTR